MKQCGCEQGNNTDHLHPSHWNTNRFRIYLGSRKGGDESPTDIVKGGPHVNRGDTHSSELTSSSRSWGHHQKRPRRIFEDHRTRASESKRTQGRWRGTGTTAASVVSPEWAESVRIAPSSSLKINAGRPHMTENREPIERSLVNLYRAGEARKLREANRTPREKWLLMRH